MFQFPEYHLTFYQDILRFPAFYHYLFQSIADGNSLEKSFHKYKNLKRLLPINIQQMIIAGERSGNLVTVLGKISGI